ncbi:site-specific integrase [Dyadobacter flavalbus]|uniref:Site-specific integrase n=1 Tax=Dyadobacter flavalbus TaxID=2579942 RepID=A0A5M8QUR7_9BACT|nr:site-specific integrase [Dyadobacter flavalbus]KAA6438574.1 site-specific integrase [Dyadobacter flavalbus]
MPLLYSVGAFLVFGTNIGTNVLNDMVKDHNTHLPYKRAVLRDRKGDLSKEWFVEFYAWSELEEKLVRKRIKIPMSFRDKKSRVEHANKLIAKANKLLEQGFHFAPKKPSPATDIVTESKNELILSLEATLSTISPTLRPKSVVTYNSAIAKLKDFLVDPVDVSAYTTQDAIRFRDHLIITLKNSPRTANNTLVHLNTVYGHMKSRTALKESPFKINKLKQQATNKNIAITDEDRAIIESYLMEHEPEVFLFTRFIYYAFIRPGELLNIRIEDVSTANRYITIKGMISKNGKTETAPIIPPLMKHMDDSGILKDKKPNLLLFSSGLKPGIKVSGKQVPFRRHEKALKELGLDNKGYTFYSWKHTGAVNAYLAGIGLKELQNFLRHSSVQITDIYLKSLGLRTDPNLHTYKW